MPSPEADALRALFQTIAERLAADPEMGMGRIRAIFEEIGGLAAEPTDLSYEQVDAGGVPALWCLPAGARDDRAILYCHGGGFLCCSVNSHRKLAAHLAKAVGVRCLLIDYRRAPEDPYPAQLDDASAAYRWLLEQGVAADHIATAGDSAGGNLSTSLVLKLRSEGQPLPAAIVALSPWYDMEADGPTMVRNAQTEALLSREICLSMAQSFLGEAGSPRDPLANPLYADARGLPPIYLAAGGFETLRDNAERFAEIARSAGVEVELEIGEGMQHVYQFMAGRAPEADRSIARIAGWLRAKLGVA